MNWPPPRPHSAYFLYGTQFCPVNSRPHSGHGHWVEFWASWGQGKRGLQTELKHPRYECCICSRKLLLTNPRPCLGREIYLFVDRVRSQVDRTIAGASTSLYVASYDFKLSPHSLAKSWVQDYRGRLRNLRLVNRTAGKDLGNHTLMFARNLHEDFG